MNIYSPIINIYFDLSDLYYPGMTTDLSQSLDLSIYRYKDYILVISAADRVDLVPYLLMVADRCIYDIGSKINDMSSALADRLSFLDLTAISLLLLLVGYMIKSTGTLMNLKARFWTCAEVKHIFQASVC